MMIRYLLVLAVSMPFLAGVIQQAPAPWTVRVEQISSPAGTNSVEPRLSVSAKGVLLSWIERSGTKATLKFSERTAASATGWSGDHTVASGDNWFVNWADVPSVMRLNDTTLVAHWLQKNPAATAAYDVRVSRSTDNGKTWSAPVTPHHDATASEHGFVTMFPTSAGAGLVWLDGRSAAAHHGAGATHDAGAMALRFSTFDSAWKQSQETIVDARVCDCCPTAAAITAEGPIVAFRDRSDKEIRDIAVSRLVGGKWSEPTPVHRDNWNITGCPVNGPALVARDRFVAVAWFTGAENQNRAFVALSKDAGRTFGAPIRLDDNGTLGRVDLALFEDGSVAGSWIEYQRGGTPGVLRVRRIQPSGERSASVAIVGVGSDRAAGFPRIARYGNELFAAWTENAAGKPPQVRTAIVK